MTTDFRTRAMATGACGAVVLALGWLGGPPATAQAPRGHASAVAARSPANSFQLVTGTHLFTGTPALLRSGTSTYLAWATHGTTTYGVSYVTLSSSGTPSSPHVALSGLTSVSDHLTLLPQGKSPLLVYTGAACVLGALGPTSPWSVQTWSLSNDCVNPVPSAAENAAGTLGAAWPGSNAVRYRVGVSGTTPATGPDSSVPVGHAVFKAGMAVDPGSQHFYVGFASEFGGSADGFYAVDVTGGGSVRKMPGTGTASINHQPPIGRMAMTAAKNGVYLAACSNTSTCQLRVWRVGDSFTRAVPGAQQPYIAAIAPGSGGRLWIAWGDQATNTVKVTRSNAQVTAFEPRTTLRTACAEHEIVGIVGPSSGAADLGLECIANKTLQPALYVAHVFPRLSESVKPSKVSNTSAHTVKATVLDAGAPVSGAQVTFHGTTRTTGTAGSVTFHVPAGFPTGHYQVVAAHSGYQKAIATLTVTR